MKIKPNISKSTFLVFGYLFFLNINIYCQSIKPNDVPNLRLWLRADSVNTVHLSGSNVLQWDNSANIDSVAQSNPAYYPIYIPSNAEINNKPTIQFNGNSFFSGSTSSNYTLNIGGSIFIILKSSDNYGNIISRIDENSPNYGWSFGFGWVTTPGFNEFLVSGSSGVSWNQTNGVNICSGQFEISEVIQNSSIGTALYLNGSLVYNYAYLPISNNISNLYIAKGLPFNSNNYFSGDIAEIIIYDRALTVIERQQVETYLDNKYAGPSVNLGADINIPYGFCDTTLDAGSRFTSFLWSTGATTQTILVDHTDTVWVDATDFLGMHSYDTIIVTFPKISLQDTLFCAGSSVTLSSGLDSASGYTYLWSDLSTDSILNVNTAGNYSVTVTDGSSCSAASTVIAVSEDNFPILASLGPNDSLCVGNSIGLIAPFPLPAGLSYQWSTLATTPTISISTSGTYSLTVTDSNGCAAHVSVYDTIMGIAPIVHFTSAIGCSGTATDFQNTSSPAGNAWDWDFGDGSTHSNSPTPSHIYSSGGDYTVRLTVTDIICSNYLDSTVHIPASPVATFSVSTACINNPFSFFDESTSSEGNIINWDWDFGDTTAHSGSTNPQHTYTSAGSHDVTLIITTSSGCSDTVMHPINVISFAPLPGSFTLIQPADSFITNNSSINFGWNVAAGAVYYKLEYSTDPLFASNVTSVPNIILTDTQQIVSLAQKYYWKVFAYSICGDSSVSNIHTFTILDLNSISGMKLWLIGDSVDSLNSKVVTWKDLSGNNNDATQSNTTLQPTFINSEISIFNRPALNFNGSTTFLSNPNPNGLTLNNGGSVFIVSKSPDNAGNIISKIDETSPNYGWTAGLGWWSGNNEGNFFVNGANGYAINSAGTIIATDTFNIYEIVHSFSTGTSIYKNTILKSNHPFIGIDNNTAPLIIAKGLSVNSNNYFSGDIAEIIIFDSPLNTADRITVEDYLHYKYAPPVNLGPDIWVNNFCDTTLYASKRFTNYLWSTGETTDSIIVNTGGTYWVSVTDVFGFHSSDTVIVHKPIVTAWSDTLCLGDSTTIYTGLGTAYASSWVTATDSIVSDSFLIHAGDTVMLHVYDTSGCSVDRQIIMYTDNFPLCNLLGAATISLCSGDTIFPVQDTGQYVSYNWFDGTSNYSTPYYIVPVAWVASGAHNLSLTCTNARGCSASDIIAVSVPGQNPVMGFTATSGCEPSFTNAFLDTSTVQGTGASIDSWTWIFDDGDTISGISNPAHQFSQPGIHIVTLIDSTNKGCHESYTDTAFLYSQPDPSFSPLLGCTGVPMQFNDHTTSVLGAPTLWSWNFDDPYSSFNSSALQNPVHVYDSAGYDTVHLVVVTQYGCTDSIDQVIYIRPSPAVSFTYTDVCDGNPVYFTNETTDPLGIYQQHWDFGNGNIFITQNPVFTFDSAGTYNVVLVVQSINGCIVNDTQQVVVHDLPNALIVPPDDICLGNPETLSDSSSVLSPDSITQWEWDFGSYGIYYGQHPVISFPAQGDYPVTLTVTSNAGCTSTFTSSIHVNPVPTASFMPDEFYGISPDTVTFSNNSQGGWNYFWNFGDGNTYSTFSALDFNHIYQYNDTFTVVLVVTNSYGCSATDSTQLYVIPTTYDVAVRNVTTQKQGNFLTVNADIWNYGTRKIYELYLYAKASDGTVFMESWSDFTNPLPKNQFMPYAFNAQFYVPDAQSIDYVCVEAQIKNYIPDDNPLNNEGCVTFSNNFTAFIPYPTPSHDEMNIDYILPFKDQVKIDLYDIRGRLVKHIYSGEGEKGLNKITVDISDLALAVYMYRIDFNEDFRILRFVKY